MNASFGLFFYIVAIVLFGLVVVAAPIAGLAAIDLLALGLVALVLGLIFP